MTLRPTSRSLLWCLQNIPPSFQPLIIPDLQKLTLPLSLTRVRREHWHLLLFVDRSRWRHRCGEVGLHDTYRSSCLMLSCRDRWEEQERLSSFPGTATWAILRVSICRCLSTPSEESCVIHLVSAVDNHYLWVVSICGCALPRYHYGTPACMAADWYLPSGDKC